MSLSWARVIQSKPPPPIPHPISQIPKKSGQIWDCVFRFITCYFFKVMSCQPVAQPLPKLEHYPFSAVCDCLFNIIAAPLHTGCRFSIRNLRKYDAAVTGTNLPRTPDLSPLKIAHSASQQFIGYRHHTKKGKFNTACISFYFVFYMK